MTESEYLAERATKEAQARAAQEALTGELLRLHGELERRVAPLRAAVEAATIHPIQGIVLEEGSAGDKRHGPGSFGAYLAGGREWYHRVAWFRLVQGRFRDSEGSDDAVFELSLRGLHDDRNENIRISPRGPYKELRAQYPVYQAVAVDRILAAGWQILKEDP